MAAQVAVAVVAAAGDDVDPLDEVEVVPADPGPAGRDASAAR